MYVRQNTNRRKNDGYREGVATRGGDMRAVLVVCLSADSDTCRGMTVGNRVLREGLLDSEKIASLHDRTFRLWIHLLLSADDYGLVEIGYGPIKRNSALLDWSRDMVSKMLAELVDAELIIPYEHSRKCYAAIKNWRSTIRSVRPKHPIPQFGMIHICEPYGFKDKATRIEALEIINNINGYEENRVPLGIPQGIPRLPLGHEGVRGKGYRLKTNTSAESEKTAVASREKISLSAEGVWENIPEPLLKKWAEAYPAVSVSQELAKASAWILSNPKNRKSQYARFLTGWISRAQDRAPRVPVQQTSLGEYI